MLVGVISDTHNRIENVRKIISLFNKEKVGAVIHTGDITKAETLSMFSDLNCPLYGVYGNNDKLENGLQGICSKYNFKFKEPPHNLILDGKRISIFHEPELIEAYVNDNDGVDIILFGHTHKYTHQVNDNTIYFNPGESAGSLEGKNALGIINLDNLEIKRIFF